MSTTAAQTKGASSTPAASATTAATAAPTQGTSSTPESAASGISIVGIGCRLPGGAATPAAFWELLTGTETAIAPIPADRGWSEGTGHVSSSQPAAPGTSITSNAGWVPDIDRFDHAAFKISRKEAEEMDPQQRLALECSYEAMLDARVDPASLSRSATGVFVGAGIAEYMAMAFGDPDAMTTHTMSGNSLAVIANRISFMWDLRGPSLTTDTACSSAMTAFHLGCQSLESRETNLALVVGVNVMLGPSPFIGFTSAQMLSPTGTSRPFDAEGNGFVRGEGCGSLLLVRTAELATRAPHAREYARVRGHGINEDGRTKSLTMPSGEAQQDLMSAVIANSGTAPEDIVYVEAHGTGTKVGDPIEAASISNSTLGAREGLLPMGSVKGHSGHCETAAGIVGLIKAALSLRHGILPPTAGFETPNPKAELARLRLRVNGTGPEPLPAPASGNAPCISINSYGFGGSNGYAILSQAPADGAAAPAAAAAAAAAAATKTPVAVRLDSHYAAGLDELEGAWAARKAAGAATAATFAADAAVFTATRPAQRYRRVLVDGAPPVGGDVTGAAPELLFAFGGQGSQYGAMGAELYASFGVFRAAIDRLDAAYAKLAGFSLKGRSGFCVRAAGMSDAELEADVMLSLPAIVFTQVALCALLTAAGATPATTTGHSTGELCAALCAGAIDEAQLVTLTYARAKSQAAMGAGAMAAWGTGEAAANAAIAAAEAAGRIAPAGAVCVACVNSATSVTLAGDAAALAALLAPEKAKDRADPTRVRCVALPIPRAYHSAAVEAVRPVFEGAVGDVAAFDAAVAAMPRDASGVGFVSSTTGGFVGGDDDATVLGVSHWLGNMRGAVQFEKACAAIVASPTAEKGAKRIAVEIAPHPVLKGYLTENLGADFSAVVSLANKKQPAARTLLLAVAELYAAGVAINWGALQPPAAGYRPAAALPYPAWEHKAPIRSVTWVLPYSHQNKQQGGQGGGAGSPAAVALGGGVTWSAYQHPYLLDHKIDGEIILPGAAYISAALQTAQAKAALRSSSGGSSSNNKSAAAGPDTLCVGNVSFDRMLPLFQGGEADEDGVPLAPTLLACVADGPKVSLRGPGDMEHASCVVPRFGTAAPAPLAKAPPAAAPATAAAAAASTGDIASTASEKQISALEAAAKRCSGDVSLPLAYKALATHSGLGFGPSFKIITKMAMGDCESIATIGAPPDGQFPAHPCVLDAAFQSVAMLHGLDSDAFIPAAVESVFLCGAKALPQRPVQAHCVLRSQARDVCVGDFDLYCNGARVGGARGLTLRRAPSANTQKPVLLAAVLQPLRFLPAAATPADALDGMLSEFEAELQRSKPLAPSALSSEASYEMVNGGGGGAPTPTAAGAGGMPKSASMESFSTVQGGSAAGENNSDIGSAAGTWNTSQTEGDAVRTGGSNSDDSDPETSSGASRAPVAVRKLDKLLAHIVARLGAGHVVRVLGRAGSADSLRAIAAAAAKDDATCPLRTSQLLLVLLEANADDADALLHPAIRVANKVEAVAPNAWDVLVLATDVELTTVGLSASASKRTTTKAAAAAAAAAADGDAEKSEPEIDGAVADAERYLCEAAGAAVAAPGGWIALDDRTTLRRARALSDVHPTKVALIAAGEGGGGGGGGGQARGSPSKAIFGAPSVAFVSLGEAEVVVDTRDDIVAASALLGELDAAGVDKATPVVLLVAKKEAAAAAAAGQLPASPVWGFSRCARNETGRNIIVVSVPSLTPATATAVLALVAAGPADKELVLAPDGSTWCVPRLRAVAPPAPTAAPTAGGDAAAAPQAVRLQIGRPGQLSTLKWHPLRSEEEGLREGELLVDTSAVSMHFKDVMLAMGMLDSFKPIIGMECSGLVRAIAPARPGEAPSPFKVGDRVMCLAMSTSSGEDRTALFGTTCRVQARQTVAVPANVSMADASGFLGVMATAWYALVTTARLAKGETLLLHSALGGVGQSALQIARVVGAKVIATAGNPEKRAKLARDWPDVVIATLDSHDPSCFLAGVLAATGGVGVDVALNSLAGDGQAESLKCMAPLGRFVEIGKRDILCDNRMSLGALKENITFHSVHLDLLDKTHPARVRALIDEVSALLRDGTLRPIESQIFPAEKVVDAFRLMSSGKHAGKVIIEFPADFRPDTADAVVAPPEAPLLLTGGERLPQTLFGEDGSVLVTGGTRGLGLEVARWAADKGARHLILLGASGHVPRASELTIAHIKAEHPGITVRVEPSLDVSDGAAVRALVASASPPIASMYHAANRYTAEDAARVESLNTGWDIKVTGACNLKNAIVARSGAAALKNFVLFTSLAGLHGNKGQAVYVAANAAMQQLALKWRAVDGLAATALDFPIVVGAGRLCDFRNAAELEINTGRGFGVVSFSQIEGCLARLAANPLGHPAHVTLDCPIWSSYHTLNLNPMVFDHMSPALGASKADAGGAGGGGGAARPKMSAEQLKEAVIAKVAFVLGASNEDVEMDVPLPDMGVDSLAAVELANWAATSYGAAVSQTEFLAGLTPQGLLDRIVEAAGGDVGEGGGEETGGGGGGGDGDATAAPAEPAAKELSAATVTQRANKPKPSGAASTGSGAVVSKAYGERLAPVNMPAPGTYNELTIRLGETLNPVSLRDTVDTVEAGRARVLVFRGTQGAEHFCTGMDLAAATFGDDTMSEGLEEFARLSNALEGAAMPLITVCHGATRGGGMLMPCMATVSLAVEGATFGFPEIRQGGLPGVVSVAAQRRMNKQVCRRYMVTGDAMSAEDAMKHGLVDFVGTEAEVERELKRLLGRFKSTPDDLLSTCYTKCPATTVERALLAMGSLDKRDRERERAVDALIRLDLDEATGVCLLELNDPTHCNAIDWAMADDLRRAIETLKKMRDAGAVRAIVFQGAGEHFCVGVNPYNFIRRTKQLPTITAGQITYEIYRAFVGVRDIGVPVVACVHGKVVGGGLAAMLNADYRIACVDSKFNYGNLPRGVCPGLLLSHNLGMTVGHRAATDLYMNDVTCSALEAREIGLVNEVYADVGAAKDMAYQFAMRMASYPTTGVRNTLALMRPPIDEERLARECMGIARCNKKGGAFTGSWKQKEVKKGEAGNLFKAADGAAINDKRVQHAQVAASSAAAAAAPPPVADPRAAVAATGGGGGGGAVAATASAAGAADGAAAAEAVDDARHARGRGATLGAGRRHR